jgi:predicted enzyme related to lactoylglutathione lyase
MDGACASLLRAGGKFSTPAMQGAPGVFVVEMSDTEGNVFAFRKDQIDPRQRSLNAP